MLIDTKTMNKMHDIQFDMLKQLLIVMDKLNVKYYFVHGSLLGAIRQKNFIIEDDDIDIAVFRDDYNRLMNEGNDLLPDWLFLQNSINDDFPLAFGKLRNSKTAFVQPVLDNYQCNQGIYIDIFPIDYSKKKSIIFDNCIKIMSIRINSKMNDNGRILYKFITKLSMLIYPSIERTMKKREKKLTDLKKSELVSIYGGKETERKMPLSWFGEGQKAFFRDLQVSVPDRFDLYLARIYGENYLNHNPAETRISADKRIEISARILDFEKTYKNYT